MRKREQNVMIDDDDGQSNKNKTGCRLMWEEATAGEEALEVRSLHLERIPNEP